MSICTQLFNRRVLLVAPSLAVAIGICSQAPAQAFQFSFDNISANSQINANTGENQLFVDVTDAAGGENLASNSVLFKFSNVGTFASSITQIYFDNDKSNVLKSVGTITSGSGVRYEASSGNLNLPAGNTVQFTSSFGIEAKKQGGVQPNGVNPGEWVSALFNLNPNQTLKDVIDDIKLGTLRFGIHVQGFENGGSEAFVTPITTPPPVVISEPPIETKPPVVVTQFPVVVAPPAAKKVPEPAAILALTALAGVWKLKRHRSAQSATRSH